MGFSLKDCITYAPGIKKQIDDFTDELLKIFIGSGTFISVS
jgi:hypothetical protein